MGYYLVEKVQVKHSKLSAIGIGRQQEFVIQLVQSSAGPSAANLVSLFTGLITLLGQAGQ